MMKFAFLVLLFFIYYIAGMYESPALMVLFLTQFLLMPVLLFLSVYLNRHLTVSFEDKLVWAEKDRTYIWKLKTENRGRLPVSRFALKIAVSQSGGGQEKKRKVRGSGGCGTDSISYKDTAVHCGILTFRVVSLKVFDYLSLFSGKQTIEDEMKVVVFPRRYEMKIEADLVSDGNAEQNQRISFLPGFNYEDIRQIREYRDGDSIRHIHWNQTARSDQLWVKEYEEEINGPVRLFLDPGGERSGPPADSDAFYTLFYALLSSLLRVVPSVHVFWKEKGKPGISAVNVSGEEQCRS